MANAASGNMVLRTLYLPLEVDRELRSIAFTRDVSKAELMRGFIQQGLEVIRSSGEKSLAERVNSLALTAGEAAPAPADERAVRGSTSAAKRSSTKKVSTSRPGQKKPKSKAPRRQEALEAVG
jgi:hypothetical protein